MPKTARPSSRTRATQLQVRQALEELCGRLRPGERIPTHSTLMRTVKASERAVLRALDDLQRAGRIVRRNGVGTFVADAPADDRPSPLLSAPDGGTIVAITRPDHSFFDRCMQTLHRHVALAGMSVVCQLIAADTDTSKPLIAPIGAKKPHGFIVFHHSLEPLAWRLHEAGYRVVMVGAPPVDVVPRVPCVYGDHELGGHLATRHLLALGHRRFAFLGDDDLERTTRWSGHQRALRDARRTGIHVRTTTIPPALLAAWQKDPALAAAHIRSADGPTGIVAWNDHQAALVLAVLNRAGVRVPAEVSLVGYDNLTEGQLVHPQLTTIDQAMNHQMQAALTLLARSTPPSPAHTLVTMPTLVSRDSCAAPRRSHR